MKIVIDTNVLISGLFFGGNPGKIVDLVYDNNFLVCTSGEINKEYIESVRMFLLKSKLKFSIESLYVVISRMKEFFPAKKYKFCRDSDDDKFIDCAIEAEALYIVSGDNDLLSLTQVDSVKIINAKDFCELFLK